jgi:hypothetical protein
MVYFLLQYSYLSSKLRNPCLAKFIIAYTEAFQWSQPEPVQFTPPYYHTLFHTHKLKQVLSRGFCSRCAGWNLGLDIRFPLQFLVIFLSPTDKGRYIISNNSNNNNNNNNCNNLSCPGLSCYSRCCDNPRLTPDFMEVPYLLITCINW